MVITAEGNKPIETVEIGNKVWTRQGFKKVVASERTGTESVMVMSLSDETTLTGTPDHPIWIDGKGFCSLDTIRYGDYIWQLKPSYLTESDSTDTRTQNRVHSEIISDHMRCTSETESRLYTGKYGKAFTERSLPSMISTISTAIHSTTRLKIWNACQRRNIYRTIARNGSKKIKNRCRNIWTKYARSQRSGTLRKKEYNGIESTESRRTNQEHHSEGGYANNAAKNSTISPETSLPDSARTNANQHGDEQAELITKNEYVKSAEPPSQSINTRRLTAVRVVALRHCNGKQDVYNLTVEDVHEYFANGILVSNCDGIRYGIYTHYEAATRKGRNR
jgi:intein/homing endonuclease